MRRLFALVVVAALGCDQPSPQDVIESYCIEHPDDLVCVNCAEDTDYIACAERDDLAEIVLEACLDHPENPICQMRVPGSEPGGPGPALAATAFVRGNGVWDDGVGTEFVFEHDELNCGVGSLRDGVVRFDLAMNDFATAPARVLFMSLHGSLGLGRHERQVGTSGPPWITAHFGDTSTAMQSDGAPKDTRLIEFFTWNDEVASGAFWIQDLCLMGVTEPTCRGWMLGTFSCQLEFLGAE